MTIQFKSSKRPSLNAVQATYALNGTEFEVVWRRENGSTLYYLADDVASTDSKLCHRLYYAIIEGETYDNNDLDLYTDIRDTFNCYDCINKKFNVISDFDCNVTKNQLHAYYDIETDELNYSINCVINDTFLVQFEPVEGFTIPSSELAFWIDGKEQDTATEIIDPDDLAKHLKLPTSLKGFLDEYPQDFTQKKTFTRYPRTK